MTIGGQTVALRPEQIGKLIEELSNARASMTPEPPPGMPPGWRFVSTKNPVMAVQKQSNGDRLLVMRHTGHGWVPFTFSPDMVIQLYMMLTQTLMQKTAPNGAVFLARRLLWTYRISVPAPAPERAPSTDRPCRASNAPPTQTSRRHRTTRSAAETAPTAASGGNS